LAVSDPDHTTREKANLFQSNKSQAFAKSRLARLFVDIHKTRLFGAKESVKRLFVMWVHSRNYRELAIVVSFAFSGRIFRLMSSSAFTPALRNARLGMTNTKRATSQAFPFSERVLETLDPCVVLMKQLVAEYANLWKDRDGVYSLAQGVVYWEPPPTVNEAIAEAMKNPDDYQLHTYCPDEGLPELREALMEKLDTQNGLSNHDVMVTSGANQAYVNCVLTFLSGGDKCVVFQPYYFNHVMAIQMTQGNNALVVGSCSDQGIPDVDWLEQALEADKRIRMVTVVNPGNPTGVSLERNVLRNIVDICKRQGVWLVLDCTYEHFDHVGANGDTQSFPGFSQEHVVHIFSFSKGHALAGFRCGYVVLSRESQLGQDAYKQMLKVSNVIWWCDGRKP
jgi:DNA-binding transcriptional MocR family regulator